MFNNRLGHHAYSVLNASDLCPSGALRKKGNYILDKGLGQQTCKVCGRPDKFNFDVPDNIWCSIVPTQYQMGVVCLACFDDFATARNIDYLASLQNLYFAGHKASFKFEVCGGDV